MTAIDWSPVPISLAKEVVALSLATERTASDGAAYGKDATLLLGMVFSFYLERLGKGLSC